MLADQIENPKIRVLILEDRDTDAALVLRELTRSGYQPEWTRVQTERDFLARLEDGGWDIILSDYRMPSFEAPTALRLLQERGLEIPFIIVSGTIGEEAAVTAIRQGAQDYLLKDRLARLGSAVTQALRQSRLRSERAQVEKEMRESEMRYRLLFEDNPVPMWVFDLETLRFLAVNDAAVNHYGYTREEFLAMTIADIRPPEELPQLHEHLSSQTANRNAGRTWRHRKKDGTVVEMEVRAHNITFDGKQARLSLATDVTERKRAEEARLAAEAKFRRLVEQTLVGTYVIQGDRFVYVNPKMTEMFRIPAEELTSRPVYDFILADDREMARTNISRRLSGEIESVHYALRMIRWDGSVIHVEVHGGRTEFNGAPAILGSMLDITERKRAEEESRESEARFRQLAENINEVFWITDVAKNEMIYISPGYEATWGRTCEGLYQSPQNWIDAIHPADRERVIQSATTKQVRGEYDEVYRILRPDGEQRWIRDRAFPVRDKSGEVYRVVGIAEDITRSKLAETRIGAFSSLGKKLSSAKTAREAAEIIVETADQLFGWDACTVDLYSEETDRIQPILIKDTVHGIRQDCPDIDALQPTPWARQTISKGAQLVLRDGGRNGNGSGNGFSGVPFGDTSRPSSSIMRVPIRHGDEVIGILSVQSYTQRAYDQESLDALQSLADHCGGALNRIRAGEDLRRAEARYRNIFENSVEGIFQTNREGHFLIANEALARILGYESPEELIRERRDISRLGYANPERHAEFRRLMEERGVVRDFENETLRKDRSKVWVSENARAVRNGNGQITGYEGTLEDITDRKRRELRMMVEHAVTAELAEGRTLAENASKILQIVCVNFDWEVGELWTVDRATGSLRCADVWHAAPAGVGEFAATSRMMRFEKGEGLPGRVWAGGQPLWVADLAQDALFPRQALAARCGLKSAIAFPVALGGEVLAIAALFSAQHRPPDAEQLAMFTTIGGHLGQFIKRKQIEEQLRQSQKMEAVGQLAGGVAHDFNNILTVIQGFTQFVVAEVELAQDVRDQLNQVLMAAERASGLTRQLLAFSRKQVIQLKILDLNQVVAGVAKMLKRMIGEDIALTLECGQAIPPVHADAGMIEQVLMNLAVNARDAMPGGGFLHIGTERVEIERGGAEGEVTARAGVFVRITVRDTGFGMAPEIISHVFEPFFTTKGAGKGTGLGLATVQSIAQQHGGWVELGSKVGVGTTFQVYFPAVSGHAAIASEVSTPPKVRGGKETILVVEDETAVRKLTAIILQWNGYRVIEAESGLAALSVWERRAAEIDLLITDMVMPEGLNGAELTEVLRAAKRDLKVVYTSGYYVDKMGDGIVLEEGVNFLQKPYVPQNLLKIVRDCLDS